MRRTVLSILIFFPGILFAEAVMDPPTPGTEAVNPSQANSGNGSKQESKKPCNPKKTSSEIFSDSGRISLRSASRASRN